MGPPTPSDVVFGARAEAVVSTVILVFLLHLQQRVFFCLHNHTWYTCTTVFFHGACTIAKKNYHRSLDLSARHSFFFFFVLSFSHSDLLLFQPNCFPNWLWLSVSLFRCNSLPSLRRSRHSHVRRSPHASCSSAESSESFTTTCCRAEELPC